MTSKSSLTAALSSLPLLVAVGVLYSAAARDSEPATALDFGATDLIIFSADGKQVIGHGRYTIFPTGDTELIRGESKYFDGEHDIELVRLKLGSGGKAPTLISYEHSFFNGDQSPQRVSSLDAESGAASCKAYVNGELEDRRSNLSVPADTYAGATQMIFVVFRLRQGADNVKFHSFNCMPGPKIVAAAAFVETERVKWSMYPGELVKLEIEPDFGWLGLLITPFIPKMYAWFDPRDNWNYVGGLYDRFYRGPRILTVRARHTSQARN